MQKVQQKKEIQNPFSVNICQTLADNWTSVFADLKRCFSIFARYEWLQLFAHQLLWVVDVRGLWQIPPWKRTAWGVGEQSRVSSCLHGAGMEAAQPPQLAHTKKEKHAQTMSRKRHFNYYPLLFLDDANWLLICPCCSSHRRTDWNVLVTRQAAVTSPGKNRCSQTHFYG